jgi:hypothetical protein
MTPICYLFYGNKLVLNTVGIILTKLSTASFATVIFTVNNNDDNHADMYVRYLSRVTLRKL